MPALRYLLVEGSANGSGLQFLRRSWILNQATCRSQILSAGCQIRNNRSEAILHRTHIRFLVVDLEKGGVNYTNCGISTSHRTDIDCIDGIQRASNSVTGSLNNTCSCCLDGV